MTHQRGTPAGEPILYKPTTGPGWMTAIQVGGEVLQATARWHRTESDAWDRYRDLLRMILEEARRR